MQTTFERRLTRWRIHVTGGTTARPWAGGLPLSGCLQLALRCQPALQALLLSRIQAQHLPSTPRLQQVTPFAFCLPHATLQALRGG